MWVLVGDGEFVVVEVGVGVLIAVGVGAGVIGIGAGVGLPFLVGIGAGVTGIGAGIGFPCLFGVGGTSVGVCFIGIKTAALIACAGEMTCAVEKNAARHHTMLATRQVLLASLAPCFMSIFLNNVLCG